MEKKIKKLIKKIYIIKRKYYTKMKFNKLIPELSVSNIKKSLDFYTKIGFKLEYERTESKFALISFQGSQIMLEEINDNWKTGNLEYPFGRGINFQIEVNDVQKTLSNIENQNHPIFAKLKTNWYKKEDLLLGSKEFLVKDLDGYLLRFFENIGTKKA